MTRLPGSCYSFFSKDGRRPQGDLTRTAMISFNGEDLTQLSWPSLNQFCERRDLFARLFSITAILWSAWSTVTTKRFNSREHTGLYTKRKFNWNWEWNYFDFGIPQDSFSYIWIFPTKVLPSISFLMRLVVLFLRTSLSDWVMIIDTSFVSTFVEWLWPNLCLRYLLIEFWLCFQVPWVVDLVACDKHLWFFRLSIFNWLYIRLPQRGKCKDPLYLSEPLHYLHHLYLGFPLGLYAFTKSCDTTEMNTNCEVCKLSKAQRQALAGRQPVPLT